MGKINKLIGFDPELAEAIELASKKSSTSVTAIVNKSVTNFLAEYYPDVAPGKSTCRKLVINLDEYTWKILDDVSSESGRSTHDLAIEALAGFTNVAQHPLTVRLHELDSEDIKYARSKSVELDKVVMAAVRKLSFVHRKPEETIIRNILLGYIESKYPDIHNQFKEYRRQETVRKINSIKSI